MKTLHHILIAAAVVFGLAGCTKDFEKINTNPNQMAFGDIDPASMLQDLLYSGTQVFLYRTWHHHGDLIQYTVAASGMVAYHRYVITDGIPSSAWDNMYRWMADAEHMRTLSEAKGETACEAIALTMKNLMLQNLTDVFGDVPCSQALKGTTEGLTKPMFDTQEDIYRKIIEDLEYANTLYAQKPALKTPDRDLLYKGDMTKWQKFNNSLLLRVLMRLSNRDAEMGISAKVAAMYADPVTWPVFTSNADAATMCYDSFLPFVNYFGDMTETSFTNTGRRVAENIINMMAPQGDPRISIMFRQPSGADGWKGAQSGIESQDQDKDGVARLNKSVLGDYASPYSLMRYDEVLFDFCEAIQRGWIPGGMALADEYYRNAIIASIRYWESLSTNGATISDTVIARFIENVPFDGTLRAVMEQKYVALFWVGYEAWAEYRRTGYPELVIGPGTQNDHILPTRLPYPLETAKNNPDGYDAEMEWLRTHYRGTDDMKTPVWWSKKAVEAGIK